MLGQGSGVAAGSLDNRVRRRSSTGASQSGFNNVSLHWICATQDDTALYMSEHRGWLSPSVSSPLALPPDWALLQLLKWSVFEIWLRTPFAPDRQGPKLRWYRTVRTDPWHSHGKMGQVPRRGTEYSTSVLIHKVPYLPGSSTSSSGMLFSVTILLVSDFSKSAKLRRPPPQSLSSANQWHVY